MIRRSLAPLSLLSLLISGAPALAKSQVEVGWPLPEVFSTTVRFVRVDRGCKVTDRDEAAGYVLFECTDASAKGPVIKRGTVELFRAESRGRDLVRIQVVLPDDPRYLELRFLELLERKLRDERGSPPPSKSPAPPPSRDAGS